MSADNYMLVRKCVPSGRWHVAMMFMSDDSPPPAPKLTDEFFGHVEDALREAACRETEYGIYMGEDVPDPLTPRQQAHSVIQSILGDAYSRTTLLLVEELVAAGLIQA